MKDKDEWKRHQTRKSLLNIQCFKVQRRFHFLHKDFGGSLTAFVKFQA